MRTVLTVCFLFCAISIFAQQAADYFPSSPGFKWINKVTPLDSLQQPVDSLTRYSIDTFATAKTYQTKMCNVVLSKSGYRNDVLSNAYLDTSYFSFSGSDSYRYFNTLSTIYSAGNLDSISSGLLNSMKGWYQFLKFGQNVNISYTILTKDTTITIQDVSYPIRFEITGKRLADENLTTQIGQYSCKKFVLKTMLGIKVLQFLIVPVATIYDTVWAAPNNWIVKSIIPATKIDLSSVNLGTVNINGLKSEVIPSLPAPNGFILNGVLSYRNSVNTAIASSKIYLLKNGITKIDSTITGTNGTFQFNNVENGAYSFNIIPALPWDGVNSTDALMLRKFLIGEFAMDTLQQKGADVNANGNINSTDALYIRRRIAGWDTSFAAGDWVYDKTTAVINNNNLTINISLLCTGDVNTSYIPAKK